MHSSFETLKVITFFLGFHAMEGNQYIHVYIKKNKKTKKKPRPNPDFQF